VTYDDFLQRTVPVEVLHEIRGLKQARSLVDKGQTSNYFGNLINTRLAYICIVVFSLKRASDSDPTFELDWKRNEFAYLTSALRKCLSNDEKFSQLSTTCQMFAMQVEKASQQASVSILEWRFGKQFIEDAQIARIGSLQQAGTAASFEIATNFLINRAQNVLAAQVYDSHVVGAFFLVRGDSGFFSSGFARLRIGIDNLNASFTALSTSNGRPRQDNPIFQQGIG
jgi:hypothetical protein